MTNHSHDIFLHTESSSMQTLCVLETREILECQVANFISPDAGARTRLDMAGAVSMEPVGARFDIPEAVGRGLLEVALVVRSTAFGTATPGCLDGIKRGFMLKMSLAKFNYWNSLF